jgi:FkbM family methyltransferase
MFCYTRNFEDVILQRVFADVDEGHYIDVGASTPIEDSNTFALYQKGWRGLAIEPLPSYQLAWQQARPKDLFIHAAAGSESGYLTLQIFDHAQQISSGSPETVAHWNRLGRNPTRSFEVPIVVLNQVIADHLNDKSLHLLCIDVEGMEHEVLKGLDLRQHRPWVVVVEATLPGTTQPAHQTWEPCLLESGYLMVYFDGANRFYLANEQRQLLGRFALPPNVWDDFVMARQMELQLEVDRLKHQVARLQGLLDQATL